MNNLTLPQILFSKIFRAVVEFELIDAGVYTVYLTDATSGLTKEKAAATCLTLEGLSPLHVKLMTTEEYIMEGCPDQAQR